MYPHPPVVGCPRAQTWRRPICSPGHGGRGGRRLIWSIRDFRPEQCTRARGVRGRVSGVHDSLGGDLRVGSGAAPRFSEPRPSGRGVPADAPGPPPHGRAAERGPLPYGRGSETPGGQRFPTSRPKCHGPGLRPSRGSSLTGSCGAGRFAPLGYGSLRQASEIEPCSVSR